MSCSVFFLFVVGSKLSSLPAGEVVNLFLSDTSGSFVDIDMSDSFIAEDVFSSLFAPISVGVSSAAYFISSPYHLNRVIKPPSVDADSLFSF